MRRRTWRRKHALRHVGLTDDQLTQRLRDELKKPPKPGTSWPHGQPQVAQASTFKNLESAQRMTQYNIDQNSDQITEWIAEQKELDPKDRQRLDISVEKTPYGDSGRSIAKSEIQKDPSLQTRQRTFRVSRHASPTIRILTPGSPR